MCLDGHGSRRKLARKGSFELLLTAVTMTFHKKLLMAGSQEIEILTQKQLIRIVWGKDDIAVWKRTLREVNVTFEINWCAWFYIPLCIPDNRGGFALEMYNVEMYTPWYTSRISTHGISTLLGVNRTGSTCNSRDCSVNGFPL